ncbi:MAG: hypothetical protein HN509_15880 [Halobacteriovoraceae bacterium]|jgi:hypothetical protein|nr:hypothetical protein [Halobacteriovoraceae bacterium]MBT5094310.1 hypothetical protein [Halobacteriovoraceae bacterium]
MNIKILISLSLLLGCLGALAQSSPKVPSAGPKNIQEIADNPGKFKVKWGPRNIRFASEKEILQSIKPINRYEKLKGIGERPPASNPEAGLARAKKMMGGGGVAIDNSKTAPALKGAGDSAKEAKGDSPAVDKTYDDQKKKFLEQFK